LLSVVGHLPNSSDDRISAKAALFVGHRIKSPLWLEKQLVRQDPRLRANAVESVWGSKADNAIRILEECADDANPRVAGNALIGLHMAGCPDVTMKAMAMAVSEDPGRRSAAAWVMGKIGGSAGDSECLECLKALMRDTSPMVRSTAVRSLAEISRAESKRLRVQAHAEKKEPELAAETTVDADAADPPRSAQLGTAPPDFDLRLDGSFVVGRRK
jgi:HEAT repeat protein